MMRARIGSKMIIAAVAALLLAIPHLLSSRYQMHILNLALIYTILISGYNMMVGVAGQMAFCQPAFWGIGAYLSSLLSLKLGLPFWAALPLAAFGSTVTGVLLGLPTLKLSGKYLALVTIGFVEITRLVLLNWTGVTGGANGLSGIPCPSVAKMEFSTEFSFYYLGLFLATASVLVSNRILNSKAGRALEAIREDELAADVMGINTYLYKIFAFGYSAFMAGIAGSLYAHLLGYIEPDMFVLREQVKMLCMLFIGGAGSAVGPVIGATFLTFLPEWLRLLKDYYMAVYGGGVVLLMIFMPSGLVSIFRIRRPPQPARGSVKMDQMTRKHSS